MPTSANAKIETSVAERIHGTCHFCQQGRIAIAVAGDHLADAYALCVAGECSGAGPAFTGNFLCGFGYCVDMVIEPDRIISQCLSVLGDACHGFICLYRVGIADKVHTPSLGNDQTDFHCHVCLALSLWWRGIDDVLLGITGY